MPDNSSPLTLNDQLAHGVRTFCNSMGLSQRKLCKLLKIDETQFSRWLSGQCQFSAEATLKILQLISLSRRDLELKFGNAERTTSKIMSLQERGKPVVTLDDGSGWVPQEGKDNDPSNSGNSIVDDDDPDTERFLLAQIAIHRKVVDLIENYLLKSKVNKSGSPEGARRVNSNATSQKAGPHPDEYPQ
jgi:transcriptional regulator with XRE-family HTH domain